MATLRLNDPSAHRNSKVRESDFAKQQILQGIAEAEEDLKLAWRQLNETTDADLIDSAVYSVKAAEIKYGALIRMLKDSG